MPYDNPTNWLLIFARSSHTFTEGEIEDAGHDDFAPLAKICPEFWVQYRKHGHKDRKLAAIWELEYRWYEAVKYQDFPKAKQLYKQLRKVRVEIPRPGRKDEGVQTGLPAGVSPVRKRGRGRPRRKEQTEGIGAV